MAVIAAICIGIIIVICLVIGICVAVYICIGAVHVAQDGDKPGPVFMPEPSFLPEPSFKKSTTSSTTSPAGSREPPVRRDVSPLLDRDVRGRGRRGLTEGECGARSIRPPPPMPIRV